MEDNMVYAILKLYLVSVKRHLKAWDTKLTDTRLTCRRVAEWGEGRTEFLRMQKKMAQVRGTL